MKLSNQLYDVLKLIGLMVIPAISAGLIALSEIWGFAVDPTIIGVLSALTAFVGILVSGAAVQYYRNLPGFLPPNLQPHAVKIHAFLLQLTLYVIPAVATFYYILSSYVAVPYPGEIVKTLITIQVFLGLILGTYSPQTDDLLENIRWRIEDFYALMMRLLGRQNGT